MAMNRLHFTTVAAALLYNWELFGQISDGKYENSRPYDHWQWITDCDVIIDPNGLNYAERFLRKKYTLSEWSGYMKDGENDWAWRCANYVRFGACFEDTQENYDLITSKVSRSSVECLKDKYDSYEAFLKDYESWPNWARNESFLEVFTKEVYDKYYSEAVSIKEFNKYHKLMKETVNRDKWTAQDEADLAAKKAAEKEAEKEAKKAVKKAAKLAEAEAKRQALIEKASEKHAEVTAADTEDDIIAPKNSTFTIEMKHDLITYLQSKYGVSVKELNVKLN